MNGILAFLILESKMLLIEVCLELNALLGFMFMLQLVSPSRDAGSRVQTSSLDTEVHQANVTTSSQSKM